MSKRLVKRSQRLGLALTLALGLTILSVIATPFFGDHLAQVLPSGVALAEESQGSGG